MQRCAGAAALGQYSTGRLPGCGGWVRGARRQRRRAAAAARGMAAVRTAARGPDATRPARSNPARRDTRAGRRRRRPLRSHARFAGRTAVQAAGIDRSALAAGSAATQPLDVPQRDCRRDEGPDGRWAAARGIAAADGLRGRRGRSRRRSSPPCAPAASSRAEACGEILAPTTQTAALAGSRCAYSQALSRFPAGSPRPGAITSARRNACGTCRRGRWCPRSCACPCRTGARPTRYRP